MLQEMEWRELFHRIADKPPSPAAWPALIAAYSESHRAYHNAAHIADCLQQLELARSEADRPDEIAFALWLHDAVYDPRAKDNEERSADWADQLLADAGVQMSARHRIRKLVLSTKHPSQPDSRDAELIVDIDLSILGRAPAEFEDYDRAIAQEYSWVPPEQYKKGRAAILRDFLDRPKLFHSAYFQAKFESQAKVNLSRAIANLEQTRL